MIPAFSSGSVSNRVAAPFDYETISGLENATDLDNPPSSIRRVAIFAEAFPPKIDGVSRSALLTLRYLRATGRDVAIFAPATSIQTIDGVAVHRLPSTPLPFYPEVQVALPSLPALIRTIAKLRRFQPDVIHLFSPATLGAYGVLAGKMLRIPVIANYQTDLPSYMSTYGCPALEKPMIAFLRALHNACTLTLAPSIVTRAELHRHGFRRLRLWERGVDLARFDPARRDPDWRRWLLNGRDPARSLVLYVGRLAHDKHLTTLHELARNPQLALTITGDGPIRAGLESQFADTDVHFTGALYGDDLAKSYASADMFAFPGTEETFGQVVLEAMASGLPVMVPDRGGAHTLIQDGTNGFVCAADNGLQFADCAQWLHEHPIARMTVGQAARQTAMMRPWRTVMQRLDRYYEEAIVRHAVQIGGKRIRRSVRQPVRWQADRAR